jgi:hypothetical protein
MTSEKYPAMPVVRQIETRPASFQPQNEVARVPSFDIESIFKLAIEKEGTADTLEKLMGIRREINAELSKKAFDESMAAFQAECPPVKKTKSVATNSGARAYSYAPLEHIIAEVKPYLEKHGFSYAFDTDTSSIAGWVIARCDVTHKGGHMVSKTAKFPLGTKTGIMSETQVYAAALTFASRRVFQNAFGIVCEGEDMDGRTQKEKPAGPSTVAPSEISANELAAKLWVLLKPVRGEKRDWNAANQWLWKMEILDPANPNDVCPNLPANRFEQVIAEVKKMIAEGKI